MELFNINLTLSLVIKKVIEKEFVFDEKSGEDLNNKNELGNNSITNILKNKSIVLFYLFGMPFFLLEMADLLIIFVFNFCHFLLIYL